MTYSTNIPEAPYTMSRPASRSAKNTVTTTKGIPFRPEQVWAVLSDLDAWSSWNPFIVKAGINKFGIGSADPVRDGAESGGAGLRPKAKLRLTMHLDGMKPQHFTPTVLEAEPGKALRWLGRTGLPGIFDGEHRFMLQAQADGSTVLIHEEQFRGLLARPLLAYMGSRLPAAFEAMNAALARECQRRFAA